jgi:lysyl endopeptidase
MNLKIIIILALLIGLQTISYAQIRVSPDQAEMDAFRKSESTTIGKKVAIQAATEKSNGNWETDDGFSIWKLSVVAENMAAIIVYFDELTLPVGSEIVAYNANNPSERTRIFTENSNKYVKTFALPMVHSNKVMVEARIPSGQVHGFHAVISEVGCIVGKWDKGTTGFGDTDPCFINVNCPDGLAYQDAKRAVAQYIYTVRGNIENCTGTLLNNTAQDDRNLFLSAHHCAINCTPAELGQAIFYFNYESPGCDNPSSSAGLLDDVVVGCTRLAASGGQHPMPPDGSDFHLFELNTIPAAYNVYYAGWNRNDIGGNIPMPGAIIQHPLSDIKKISFIDAFTQAMSSTDFYANCIQMSGTGGIIEPNASGSGVFDNNKRIIGTISYGSAGCVIPGEFNMAAGGKFFAHWDQNGTNTDRQLKSWLDPTNSGVITLDGKNSGIVGTNIQIEQASLINIFPNPSDGMITVTNANGSRIRVLNAIGITVIYIDELQDNNINLSQLDDGIYFVLIEKLGNEIINKKVIKLSYTK